MIKLSSEQPRIIVVGSSSVDLVLNTERFPYPNTTVISQRRESFFGGKGANQAVGTARLGASVYFIGRVGMDSRGQQVLRNLRDEGINVGFVTEDEEVSTGSAFVMSNEGNNAIVVVPSANYELKNKHIDQASKVFATTDLVLLQLEIPMDVVEHTIKIAKQNGKKVGIYTAPAVELPTNLIENTDFIVAKKSEISILFKNDNLEELLNLYPNKLFVRDNNITTYHNGKEIVTEFTQDDAEIHKMGMGDAFTSGFAVAYCHQNTIADAVKFGNAVASRVAKVRGSQKGLPYLKDLVSH